MNLIDRAKNIIVTPKTEWDVIAAETTPIPQVVTGYVLPLAAAAAVAAMIGMVFVGASMGMFGTMRMGFGAGLAGAIIQLVMSVVMVFVVGFIIDALAPTFGGTKNRDGAIRVAAYTYTPVWVVGLLAVIPALGVLGLLAALYAIYLLYLGLPRIMRAPQDKAAGYTAVVIVVAIVVGIVAGLINAAIMTGMSPMSPMRGAAAPGVVYDKDSAIGKLDAYSKKMEEASKRMEAASKSGDPKEQMGAAMGALGTALSGGKGVEPVQLDVLKPLAPEQFAGLPRTEQDADRSGVAGLMAAKVGNVYRGEGKRVRLEITDTGGAVGLMGLVAWAATGATSESENADRIERMKRDGDRLVREEISKRGGTNTYTVILGERFVVSAQGSGVDIDTLRSGVNKLDLAKMENMK